ncbi:ribosome silencing factor [Aquabacterium sp. CECT 9606]|uniref:ribosome silencing factor n=1 Tax=Aquabacterium sp. CECT 9606 TaxID=2845822 RepID=UPI001E5D72A2|nr:ribosome silencing factor [Aquabacterium sp. CECT 9606]CAH0349020.1 Ribosomal silencing factor RsfS [Aquabacterium sp. CECT 9606]
MDIRKLQRAIVDGLEDVKGQDIVVFNTEHLSALFERVIVASGTSNRQTKALAASVRKSVRAAGFDVMRTEGEDNGEWIIVDCAAAVVHLMQPAIRQYYLLEEIWGEKPIKLKLNDVVTRLVKASEPMDDDDAAPKKASGKKSVMGKLDAPVRKVAAKKVVAKKAVAKTPAERSTSNRVPVAAKKIAAKKAAAKKVAAAIPVVPKTMVINKPAVKKVAGKKVAAKKVAAKKAPVRKMVAAKKVARKAS